MSVLVTEDGCGDEPLQKNLFSTTPCCCYCMDTLAQLILSYTIFSSCKMVLPTYARKLNCDDLSAKSLFIVLVDDSSKKECEVV